MLKLEPCLQSTPSGFTQALPPAAERPGGAPPDRDQFSRLIEAALRTEGDLTALARNAAHLNLRCVDARARRRLPPGAPLTAAERGQTLWEILQEAIGRLRPADEMDPRITRAWRQYRVLHDAYLQGLPNRQIARSLYISARTFDRDRRQALGRVCQIVWEMETACRLSRPSGSGAPSCVRTQ